MEAIGRALFEFGDEVEVERPRFVALGVDEEPSATNRSTNQEESSDDIGQECRTDSAPFVSLIDAESREERHRLGVAPGSCNQATRCIVQPELCHRPRVVGDDPSLNVIGDDEDLGRVRRHGLPGVSVEPCGLLS